MRSRLETTMRAILSILLLGIFFTQCTTERALPTGYNQLQRQYKGEVLVQELKAVDTAHYWQTPAVGAQARVLLGQYAEALSYAALRFYPSTVLDTSAVITSAELVLSQNLLIGQAADSLS